MRKWQYPLVALAILLSGLGYMVARDRGDKPASAREERQDDRQAIDKLVKEYSAAVAKGDARALLAYWSDGGEYVAEDGEVYRGRESLEKAYRELFTRSPGRKLSIDISSIRFPSEATAVVEATVRATTKENELEASSWVHALLVREQGKWKLAVVREWERSLDEDLALKDLNWLVGTWVASNKDREVTTTYEWNEKKTMLVGRFSVKDKGKEIDKGQHFIVRDNAAGVIRSWVFESEGGFGGGVWSRDGKQWRVESAGVLPDGREATAVNVYVRLDNDAYSWQSVERTLDGFSMPSTEPIKVVRKKP